MMVQKFIKVIGLALVTAAVVQASYAIVIRHDRDDQRYLALGAKYPVTGYFQESVTCTLIAPQWALTAAHTIEDNPAFINYYVMFGATRYEVEKVIIHPLRVKGSVDSSADLALLKLRKPVEGITPALLYDRSDEADKDVILTGYGRTGNGLTGQTGDRGKLRGATNKIEGPLENSLLVVFDPPPYATELEGTTGAGDSGGPALYEENGKLYIMGVVAFSSGSAEHNTLSKYHVFSGYARISTRRSWILETMKTSPPDSLWTQQERISLATLPTTVMGNRASAFFAAFNSGDEAAIAKFNAEHRLPHPEGRTPQERAKGWQEMMDRLGSYELRAISTQGRFSHAYLVYAEGSKTWRGVQIDFEEKSPFRIKALKMWDVKAPVE